MPSESPISRTSTPAPSQQAREAGVVAGEHGDLLAGGAHLGQVGLGQAAGDALSRHGFGVRKTV
jgi:hypothetical protein